MQKLIVALTLLFGGIAANDRDGHSRLLRGRGKTVDHPEAGSKAALSRQDAGDEPVRAAARRLATVEEGIPPECVLAFEAVTKDGTKLKDFPACIDNLVVVAEAVLNKPESFADAGPDARDSILIQMIAKNRKSDTVIPFDDEETVTFKSSDVFALPAVAKNGMDLQKYPESKENLIVVMQAVLKTPNAFEFAGCHAQSDLLIQLVATGLQPENLDLVQKGCGEQPTPAPTAAPTVALNGCGKPCADVVTISSTSFPTDGILTGIYPTIESDNCYVVDGTFPKGDIKVPTEVNCAKITVPSSSGIRGISVDGNNNEVVNEGEVSLSISVYSTADGTKITNTGTKSDGDTVLIQVYSATTEVTVSDPGEAKIGAFGGFPVTFKCYGVDVTVPRGKDVVCDGLPPTAGSRICGAGDSISCPEFNPIDGPGLPSYAGVGCTLDLDPGLFPFALWKPSGYRKEFETYFSPECFPGSGDGETAVLIDRTELRELSIGGSTSQDLQCDTKYCSFRWSGSLTETRNVRLGPDVEIAAFSITSSEGASVIINKENPDTELYCTSPGGTDLIASLDPLSCQPIQN